MSSRRKPETAAPDDPRGFWRDDGSWCEDSSSGAYVNAASGTMTRFVRQLVWMRRHDGGAVAIQHRFHRMTPAHASVLIHQAQRELGFPNHLRWARLRAVENWRGAPCATSAEAAVIYGGHGNLMHWDGGMARAGIETRWSVEQATLDPILARTFARLLGRLTSGELMRPSEVATWLQLHAGDLVLVQTYAKRLETIPDDVPTYPPLPTPEDLARIDAGDFDPTWYPNPGAAAALPSPTPEHATQEV